MEYRFADLLDVPLLQEMADKLYRIAKIPVGIIDVDGTIHVKAGWQNICTEFHRVNEETQKRCLMSGRYINDHLRDGVFLEYKC